MENFDGLPCGEPRLRLTVEESEDTLAHPLMHATPRLYTPWGATLAAVTGGIFPGMLLAGLNFRAWGENRRARRAIGLGIIGTLLMVTLAMIIPYDAPWGRPVYQGIQVAFVVGYFYRFQKERIEAHRAAGGLLKSSWRATWIGVGCGFAFTILYFGTGALIDLLA